jgi:hypothetical protein
MWTSSNNGLTWIANTTALCSIVAYNMLIEEICFDRWLECDPELVHSLFISTEVLGFSGSCCVASALEDRRLLAGSCYN